ncbi:WD domain, G-beta repeat protein (macronuclear) [Tetrahymena thermophila SB210]|uniref:WD domain, G-beta repeat protein n=2 Tax=Tetrahymena thermophila (strain SB210) TaxID=312017 RepID=I7MDI1_TETTS|nr:WD domain, G-beta repeat protein [Tetrahymena thermophila SB210]EAR87649.2 WD domain, G-beta repeat protein [Tetrahymena thermophila SB210]|eukprot:XP_001007894.2 WD domain, G-beta repeat protein [Tetrahymena thermophila SB210]
MSFQDICPFDIDLGYSSTSCQGQIGDQNVLGGELLFFKNKDKYEQLMVDYGSQGLLGVWNLTDASLFYSTSYFSDKKIQIHSIYTDKQINISDPSLPRTFIYIIDINYNVYQQSLYQQNSTALKFNYELVDSQQQQIQICYNIKNNILYYPKDNYVYLSSIEQSSQLQLDSDGIQCESDFSQEYIYVLSSNNNIYMISQTNFEIQNTLQFQLGNITRLKFQQSQGLTFISYNTSGYSIFSLDQNFNYTNLLFFSPNQINDYGFLNDGSLIVCGNNSMIYFGSQFINPATLSMDYNDYHVYDNLNALRLQDLKLINYTKLIVGDDFTVFYGNQTMITVVVNENRVIQLNKCLGSQLLFGVTPNAIFEGSILKTLTSSGMVFIDITNGQIKRHTSCFYTNDIPNEQVEGLYFDDELLRIYMIENQGKLGYFSYPKGEYLTQYYNLSTQSRLQFNKYGDQIYIWPSWSPQNYLVITTYLEGTFLQTLNFDNDFKVSQVYFDNDLEIILVIDLSQKLFVFNSKQFNLLYDSPITNYTLQVFQSQYGIIIVYQNLIQMLIKGQDSNHQIQINTLNLQNYYSNQTYFDTFSNSLILFNVVGMLQIAIIENPQNINIKSLSFTQKQNQVSQNVCFGNQYLVILMASPNEIILINKQTNDLQIINFAFTIPNQCLLLMDEKLLLVVSDGNQLIFIDVQSQIFLKNEQLDLFSSAVSSIQIDEEEKLLIILLSTNQIFSYDYSSLQQVCDWMATNITLSTFQINTSYKKIIYGSGLMIYFIDYTQKKLMNEMQFEEQTQGGVIDQQTNTIFIYTNKVYKYDLQTNNLILVSKFEHLKQINQLNIIYEWGIIVTSSLDNTIAIHSYPELKFIQLLQHDPIDCQIISSFAVDVENNRIISGCGFGSIYVWKNDISIKNFYLLKDYQYLLQIYTVTRIIIDQENNFLMLFGLDWFPLLVQLSSIDQEVNIIQVLQGNDGAYDKLNQCILTFDQDGYVWNYNITTQSYIFTKQYPIHQGQVQQIVLDPINQRFVSMGLDNKVQIWPYNSQNAQIPLFQYKNIAQIQYGYLDLDNQILIISDSNFRIVLLQFPLLNVIQVFDQHKDVINSFILNQNSFQIISFSNDQTVKFWEYEFSIQNTYFQIIHRASSIISYAFDENNNNIYYTRSDGNIQKWSLMDQQAVNGPILQFNDRFNNTIYLINEDIFVLATTKQINLIYKKNLELIQKIQVECSHSVNKQDIIVCGYNQQITSYQIIQNGNTYNFLKLYQQKLDKPLYKFYNGILLSTEFIIIFVNHSIAFVESSTGLITKQFPLIHQLAIIDLIIYTEQIIFSYSFDSQLVQYLVEDNDVQVQRQTQLGYPIFQVIVEKVEFDYIISVLSYNYNGINYMMIDSKEQSYFADNNINTKQFLTFNNTVDFNYDSEFIFRNNKIANNKINLTTFFLVQYVNKITMDQNEIFDNISIQLSFLLQTVISTNIMISYLNFNNNINLAIIDDYQFLQQYQKSLVNNLEVQDSYFGISFSEIKQNKYLIPDSYMIYTNSSSIDLLSTSMKSQLSNSSIGLITLISNQLQITNFTIEESQLQNVSPIVISQSQVIIDQSYFISNKLYSTQYGGGVFYFDASLVKIQNSQFIDNEAQNGGSLYFINMCDCLLNNVTFSNNTARENGGVFLLNDSNIQIQNSTFERNKALIGGIARYFTFIPIFLQKNSSDLAQDSCGTTYQNNCIDNYGQFYGNNFCSFPQSAKINNQSLQNGSIYIFKDVQSGTQNNILKINILDEEGNQVKFQSKKNIPDRILQEFSQYYVELQELYLLNNIQDLRQIDLKLQGATIQAFELDQFLLNQYQVSGQLGKIGRAVLQFKGFHLFSNQTQGFTDTLTIYIDYSFRNCQIGEIIQSACTSCSLANCYTCQNGTYSIQDPNSNTSNMQCKPCDYSSSISCQGSQINLKQGFWRSDKFNDDIIPCTKSQNFCNGQEETNYCSEGLIGPLCQTCDVLGQFWNNSYGKSGLEVNCYQCQSEVNQIAEQMLICLFTLLYLTYLFYQTKINLNMMTKVLIIDRLGLIRLGNSGQIGEKSFYSRLMIRYLQIFISISSLSPKPIFNLQIISIFSPVSSNQNLLDCIITVSLNKIRSRFILNSRKILLSFASCSYSFSCSKAPLNLQFRFLLAKRQCYSTDHVILITSMIMPMTFLWIVLVPGILIYKIWSKSQHLDQFSHQFGLIKKVFINFKSSTVASYLLFSKIHFLIKDYPNQVFQKKSKILNFSLVEQAGSYDVLSKASLMLIILYCYLLLLQKFQPYQKVKYYKIDLFFSQICCLLTILYILLNVIEQDILLYLGTIIAYILQAVAFSKIFLIYLDVLIRLNYHLLKQTKVILILQGSLKKNSTCFKFFKQQLKQHMNSLYLLIYCTEDNSFKKFNNFQLLRLSIQDYFQRKKRDKYAPFFSNHQPNDENSFKETNNLTNSTRKVLLSKRMKEMSINKQSGFQLNQNQNSPKRFLVQFNSEGQSPTQNSIFSQQFSPKLNIKFSELQNKNQTQIDSQFSENVSEYEANQQNNCQAKYNFRTRSNIKNINPDQFVLLSNPIEQRDYQKNDKDLDIIFYDKPSAQKKKTLQSDEANQIE